MHIKRLLLASKLQVPTPPSENGFHSSFLILSYGFASGFADGGQGHRVHGPATRRHLDPFRRRDADTSGRP